MRQHQHVRSLALATMALVVVSSCKDEAPLALEPRGPEMEIVDAAHSAGLPNFYFLPPMVVAEPTPTGLFDPSLLPHVVVVVCELAGTACGPEVARFTADGGLFQRVTVSQFSFNGHLFEQYLAVWRTDRPGVRVDKVYRATVLVAGTPLGHADVKFVTTKEEALAVNRAEYAIWVKGLPLPIRFRIEQGAVFPVGPGAATVTTAGGVVQLDFPAGAVSNVIGVTVVPASDLPTDAPPIAGTAFDFGPDGAQFAQPVRLTIRYDPAAVPADVDQSLLRLHKLVGGAWDEVPGSSVDLATHTVSGDVNGFSVISVLPARPAAGALGQIAFVSDRTGNGDVFLMEENGLILVNLTEQPANDRDPVWSTTGEKLAFVTNRDGNDEVYVMDVAGTPLTNVSNRSESDYGPSWTPGAPGGDLVFVGLVPLSGRPPMPRLFVNRSDGGTAAQRLATTCTVCPEFFGDFRSEDAPLGSPNGMHVAFRYNNTDWMSIRVVNTATGDIFADPGIVLVGRSAYWAGHYAWRPTEPNKFAFQFVRSDGTGGGVYLADVAAPDFGRWNAVVAVLSDGPDTRTVTVQGRLASSPALVDTEVLTLNGTSEVVGVKEWEQVLTLTLSASDAARTVTVRQGAGGATRATIGPNETKLTAAPDILFDDLALIDLIQAFGGDGPEFGLAWSPDGSKLAFVSLRDGNREIYVCDLSVTPCVPANLTMNDLGSDWSPTWSPDGRKIAFVSDRDGNEEIYVMDLSQPGVATRLTNDPAADHSPRWRPQR